MEVFVTKESVEFKLLFELFFFLKIFIEKKNNTVCTNLNSYSWLEDCVTQIDGLTGPWLKNMVLRSARPFL
jgi:hypothetical protein